MLMHYVEVLVQTLQGDTALHKVHCQSTGRGIVVLSEMQMHRVTVLMHCAKVLMHVHVDDETVMPTVCVRQKRFPLSL